MTLSYPCPHRHLPIQEQEHDWSLDNENHSDGLQEQDEAEWDLLEQPEQPEEPAFRCVNCNTEVSPHAQLCHWCRTEGHRVTGLL